MGDNIKMYFTGIAWEDWSEVAQDSEHCNELLNSVSAQRRHCMLELIIQ
jgi:hypothetical protein